MKVGVIGTGNMGEHHVRTYALLSGQCKLAGIYDKDKSRAASVAGKYGAKAFSSLDELLKEVDAVSICVPTPLHYEVGLACVEHGVHMMMEKPFTETDVQAKTLTRKAGESGVTIQVGHIELYNPVVHILKRLLKDERVIAIDVHRMNPYSERIKNVDVIEDLMIHDLYILRELLGEEWADVHSLGIEENGSQKHTTVAAIYKSGIVAQLTASYHAHEKTRTIRVLTEGGLFRADFAAGSIKIIRQLGWYLERGDANSDEMVEETIQLPPLNPLKSELTDFLSCIKDGRKPLTGPAQGMAAMADCRRIKEGLK